MGLTLNLNYATQFLKQQPNSLAERVGQIHNQMHSKTMRPSQYLGWLDLPIKLDKEELARMINLSNKFESLEVLVVIGIGGSYLGAKAGLEFLTKPFSTNKREIIFAGANLSGEYLAQLIKYLENKDFAINVISKSGTTTEPAIAFRILKEAIEKKYGKDSSKRIFATTDKARGALYQLAYQNNYERFVIPDDVGGRFSVFTAVGLLPFVFAGFDIENLIKGAQASFHDFNNEDLTTNLAYQYAATRYLLHKEGKDIEMLVNYEPRLIYFSEWWKQLFGESEGKDHKGLFVASATFTTDLHSLGQYIQQGQRKLFETVIDVENVSSITIPFAKNNLDELNYLAGKDISYVNKQALNGTLKAHVSGGVPNIIITIEKFDEYHLGYLFYFFEVACAMSAYLLGVDPFNQPGVEDYKRNMFELLGKK